MKKEIWLLAILGVIIIILIGILLFVPAKDRGLNPVTGTEGLEIYSLKTNQEIFSPLKITGRITGSGWAGFEGQVGTVKLLDSEGKELTTGILTATTDWMIFPVSFKTTLNFKSPATGTGILVFKNENPSGLPEKDASFSLPIRFSQEETMEAGVFFGNLSLSSSSEQDECQRTYKIIRYIKKTSAVAQVAINELLKGPIDAEMLAGFFTSIPAGSKLNSISIVDGQALVDFNEVTESGGGSCSMAARVAQITQTLLQFPTVKSVKLSVNGRTGDIFQP